MTKKNISDGKIVPACEIDKLIERVRRGKRLTDTEVKENLYLARDAALVYLTKDVIEGALTEKARVRVFNSLQNAVERYEKIHDTSDEYRSISIGFELSAPEAKAEA